MNNRFNDTLAVLLRGLDVFCNRAEGRALNDSPVHTEISAKLKAINGVDVTINVDANDVVDTAWQLATGEAYKTTDKADVTSPISLVFNRLNNGKNAAAYKVHKLTLDEIEFFAGSDVRNSRSDYAGLWNQFVEEFKELPGGTFRAFFDSALYLLKKYCWAMPVNSTTLKEISLYDAVRLAAAFVGCNCGRTDSDTPYLFMGGDLSGIQKFIYNITSRKAAVSLKGRSFYLQLLVDSAIQRILYHQNIDLPLAQIIYSSGGKFYMLLPNSPEVVNALEELKTDFQTYLWNELYGQLLLNIAYIPFGNKSDVSLLWKQLADKLTEQKNRKFESVIKYTMFQPQSVNDYGVCAITGIEADRLVPVDNKKPGSEIKVLPSVYKQIELGTVLKDADFIITHRFDKNFKASGAKCDVEVFGIHNYLFDKAMLYERHAEFREISGKHSICVKRINETDRFLLKIQGNNVSYGFQYYGGNRQAQENGDNKTFDQLAGDGYLGVLRMDVDSLGSIFIQGLPDDLRTFAGYSTLSFMLDYFFSGYLNVIRERYSSNVNILYSGGDDVFAIGRWDDLLLFAEDIRRQFARFVCRNDISISGGIVMVDGKFPISKSAEMAGEEEERAKQYADETTQKVLKNAFSMFGQVLSWDSEFGKVKECKNEMVDLCRNHKMPRSILHRIMMLFEESKRSNSWLWHWVYYISRFAEGKTPEVRDYCGRMKKILCSKTVLNKYVVAARWAELELRFND